VVVTTNEVLDLFRAKSKDTENYLLKDHLKATIERAIQLRDFVNQNKDSISYDFNDIFFEKLIIACFLHDLGKIDFGFQWKLLNKEEKTDENKKKFKQFFNNYKEVNIERHEAISLIYSSIFLDNDEWAKKIRTAILLHHYNDFYVNLEAHIRYIFDEFPDLEKYVDFLIKNKAKIKDLLYSLLQYLISNIPDSFAKEVLDSICKKLNGDPFGTLAKFKDSIEYGVDLSAHLSLFEVPNEDEIDKKPNREFYDFFVFLGCLRRCDYSASGDVDIEEGQNLSQKLYKDLDQKIKTKLNRDKIWQEEIIEEIKNSNNKNLILIAPTGSGKTEFALLWASNIGKKLIYTLPLRVALNELYYRFRDSNKGYFNNNEVGILHSTSFIEYLEDKPDMDIGSKITTSKLFSTPLTLTTPDQVFLSSLKYYGFDKLISIYPLSSVVIDEIQAYKPEMAAIIIKTLEMIKELHGNLLIMTATFPPYFEKFLIDQGFHIEDIEKENIKEKVKNYKLKRHRIKIYDKYLFMYNASNNEDRLEIDDKSLEIIKKEIERNPNKNILIIVNTVGKAIKLYKEFEKSNFCKVEKGNLYLLHSRLIEKEKGRRIKEIESKLPHERVVLIATEIVEASVDVDFDILITEASPIDSQIQRWGRVYRNRDTGDYNEDYPNILIFGGDDTKTDKGTNAIYDETVVKKTIEVLKKYEGQYLDYEKERCIIEEVFNADINGKTLKDVYIDKIKENLEWLKYTSLEKKSEAQRIFRRIAGIQVLVPDLIEAEELKGIIQDKENWDLSLDEIANKIKEKTGKEINKWEVLQILHEYSVNLPIFTFNETYQNFYNVLERKTFRGFFVLNLNRLNLDSEDIRKYGIDKIPKLNIDIDQKEIEAAEENII
jgi:CRISPR-associated endonuclease/helicase Cas3